MAAYFYMYTYHSRFIPAGVAEASHMFLLDAHVYQTYLAMGNTAWKISRL
jgi:hypothetical protein